MDPLGSMEIEGHGSWMDGPSVDRSRMKTMDPRWMDHRWIYGDRRPWIIGGSIEIKNHGSSVDRSRSKTMDPRWIDQDRRPWILDGWIISGSIKTEDHGSSVDRSRLKAMDPRWIDQDRRPWILSGSIKIEGQGKDRKCRLSL